MSDKSSILIVDDNPQNISVLGTLLRQENYRVIIAQNGVEALEALDKIEPELILLDILMPELDGFETCKQIKKNPEMEAVSVIFLTAKDNKVDMLKGFEVGGADYITKPFNSDLLLARVKTHIKLHQYHTRLQQQVFLDGLTQISNRFRFEQALKNEWNRHLRMQHSLAVMMVDVDLFKLVNDDYGHLAGDEVLKKIAQTLEEKAKRAGDFVARYGGEEFALVLSHTELDAALLMGERLRSAVAKLNIPNINAPLKQLTISIGVAAIVPEQNSTARELVAMADKQLYIAKEQGRNQVRPISI